jgi:nucleoside-diphosphate-sugar epimerase
MRILVTGYTGFVGSALTSKIEEHSFVGLDVIEGSNVTQHFNWDSINLIPETDAIIHLAGKAHDTANTTRAESYFEVNFELTKIIFDHFLRSDAKVFIFFSSVKAVADSVRGDILSENDTPNPMTPYGQSKLAAETYILGKEIPDSKAVYILRPAMIHGPGNKGNLNLLYSVIKKGIPYPLGAFPNKRSFSSVENVLFIIRKLLSDNPESGIYNICDDDPLSTVEVVEMVYKSLGRRSKILNIPGWLINKLAAVGDVLRLPLNTERLKKMTESYVVSNEKIKAALDIDSLPVTAHVGMLGTLNHFSNLQQRVSSAR